MAILKIAKMGNPVLHKVADPVVDPVGENIASLVEDMKDTLIDISANGLAANQVYVSKRVIVYRVTEHQIPPSSNMKPIDWQVLINPVITPLTEEKKPIWERCLSVPGLHGKVDRYTHIELNAKNLNWEDISITARGFHAMLLQHEYDHLDGILYPMQMTDMSTLAYNSELGDKGFFVKRDDSEFIE